MSEKATEIVGNLAEKVAGDVYEEFKTRSSNRIITSALLTILAFHWKDIISLFFLETYTAATITKGISVIVCDWWNFLYAVLGFGFWVALIPWGTAKTNHWLEKMLFKKVFEAEIQIQIERADKERDLINKRTGNAKLEELEAKNKELKRKEEESIEEIERLVKEKDDLAGKLLDALDTARKATESRDEFATFNDARFQEIAFLDELINGLIIALGEEYDKDDPSDLHGPYDFKSIAQRALDWQSEIKESLRKRRTEIERKQPDSYEPSKKITELRL